MITDGRFSGSNKGGFIGHICPEAAEGGLIALVKDGDIISIDINRRNITLEVPDDEIEIRRAGWTKKEPKVKKGYLALYAKIVSSANKGAILSSAE